MILVVVSMGATVFAFATGGFGSLGNSFSSLLGTAGNKVSEDVVIEQVVFVNTGVPATSGANLYVRDIGINPTTIAAAYVQNMTSVTFVEQFTGSPLPLSINSGSFQIIFVKNFVPDHGQVYGFTLATSLGNTVTYNAKYY
jgi:hypothetical protein